MKKVIVDLSEIEEADDGNTTYYGGTYKVGSKELQAHGNDRGDGFYTDLYAELAKQLGVDRDIIGDLVAEALAGENDMMYAGMVYEFLIDDGGRHLKGKVLHDQEPKPPSKDQAEYWLKALGIEFKMEDGQPMVKVKDADKIKKIFE